MDLVHCIYCSASVEPDFSTEQLEKLLAECRRKNSAVEITGMLLYQSGSFFQILEGDRDQVQSLYDRIAADKRHARATKLIFESIPERDFAEWTMGFPKASRLTLAEIPGLNDFFGQSKSYLELGEGRAKKLLTAFKEGSWRSTLT